MWIVFNALVLYNVTVVSGRFQNFRQWMLEHLPNDRRVVLVVVGFCFGCLLEESRVLARRLRSPAPC